MTLNTKTLGINIAVFIVLILIVELVMKFMGYECGIYVRNIYFNQVDTLIAIKGYETDTNGITKMSSHSRKYIAEYIANAENRKNHNLKANNYNYTPYALGKDYLAIINGEYQNEFSKYYFQTTENQFNSDYEKRLIEYVHSPINEEGFRSLAFQNIETDRIKILLLGDSFTWGQTVRNKADSFAEHLLSKGYVVYNSGIVGADLPQYHAIAKKYMAILNPDIVIVNLYMGNDISKYNRIPNRLYPVFYATNAGNLYSCPHGIYFDSPQKIYDHIVNISTIPETDLFNTIMAKTRISTQLWSRLVKLGKIQNWQSEANKMYWDQVSKNEIGYSINVKYLEAIASLSNEHGAKFMTAIIPNHEIMDDKVEQYLSDFPFYKDTTISLEDYHKDGHFNERGHKKYADFLDVKIRALLDGSK